MDSWIYIGIFVALSFFFPALLAVLGWFLGPRRPNPVKQDTYECGLETVGETWVQFKIQYYLFALVFLIFDVELVFLYPWAVAYHKLPFYGVIEGVIFVVMLAAALVYAWRKGALEWA